MYRFCSPWALAGSLLGRRRDRCGQTQKIDDYVRGSLSPNKLMLVCMTPPVGAVRLVIAARLELCALRAGFNPGALLVYAPSAFMPAVKLARRNGMFSTELSTSYISEISRAPVGDCCYICTSRVGASRRSTPNWPLARRVDPLITKLSLLAPN